MGRTRRLSFTGRGHTPRLASDRVTIRSPRFRNAKAMALEAWEEQQFVATIRNLNIRKESE